MFTSPSYRIYVHDTDVAGVVHHSNYLKYFEAGRIEFLRSLHVPYIDLQKEGIGLVPISINIRYIKPLREDDLFHVTLLPTQIKKASVKFDQQIVKDATVCVEATIQLACVKEPEFKPIRIPHSLFEVLSSAH